MKKSFISIILILVAAISLAQTGGKQAFSFLQRPTTVLAAGLGGKNVSLGAHNPHHFLSNPATLSQEWANDSIDAPAPLPYSVNFMPLWSGAFTSTFSFTDTLRDDLPFGVGFQYISFGELKGYDANGNSSSNFGASAMALTFGTAKTVGLYTMGANVKLASSYIERYSAYAALLDIGGQFRHPTKDLTIGMLFQNIGWTFKNYTKGVYQSTPFDVRLGATYKPAHMPVRFNITLHHLYQWDIAYYDERLPDELGLDGEPIDNSIKFTDKLFRHFTFGAQLVLSPHFELLYGYDVLTRRELNINNSGVGLSGMSIGGQIRTDKFRFGYVHQWFLANNTAMLTFSTNVKGFSKR